MTRKEFEAMLKEKKNSSSGQMPKAQPAFEKGQYKIAVEQRDRYVSLKLQNQDYLKSEESKRPPLNVSLTENVNLDNETQKK